MNRFLSIRVKVTVFLLLLVSFAFILCSYYHQGLLSLEKITPALTEVAAGDWYSVYFADPGSPNSLSYRAGPEEHLAAAIDQARLSVDVAIYDFDLWRLRDALLAADQRGVALRLLCDGSKIAKPEIQALIEAGIPVKGSWGYGLMHNKFVIIDRREVWTGSMNFTRTGAYLNNNNLIRIRSTRLAQNYLVEFEEMFIDGMFGSSSPSNTPYPTFMIEGTQIEVYFSPDDSTEAQIIRLLGEAETSIYFMAYSFTSSAIADAMIDKAQSGVTVSGVFERTQYRSNIGSEFISFAAAGLDVRLDGNPRNMHHKVIIIDERVVITGSYNFSSSAGTLNDENSIIIHNKEIARLYLDEFERVFNEGIE
ncbi:MAG: phospholipase [Anaerolineales bacterium]|nr:phospholipase [Anaerolineales bacterium]